MGGSASAKDIRDVYGRALVEIGHERPDLFVIGADLAGSNKIVGFARAFPERYFNIGIAEQNMVGIAAGLACFGKLPYAHSFACFISMRSCEQVRTDVCYPNLNVKFVATHGGLSLGPGGTTHHAIEDIAIMKAMPNMTVMVPSDGACVSWAAKAIADIPGPVYLRLGRGPVGDIYPESFREFQVGRAVTLRQGRDVSILSTGLMVGEALKAAEYLSSRGISASVMDIHTIKPLDAKAVSEEIRRTGLAVVAEEHSIIGGLGSAVADVIAEEGIGARLKKLGIRDHFSEIGPHPELLKHYGLSSDGIAQAACALLSK